jgi:ABC transporter substrate binding protein (PQQ-dependent alcohol dehydrogenase system)
LVSEVKKRVDDGAAFVVADTSAEAVLALADALKGRNAGHQCRLQRRPAAETDCRTNVVHTAPSRAMLADGLAQYLVWKQWRRWFLVRGTRRDDEAFAEALRRSAKRFGGKIVEERTFKVESGSRRADGGHEQIQQQIPTGTQNAPAHDVLLVADEGGQFGEYFPYRTWDARPVAGTRD